MAQILNLNHFGIVQSQITPSCLSPSTSLKMKLPHLPDELLLSIVKRLHSETHISALSHTNRRLHSVLNEDLYRHNTRWGESSALYCAAMHGRVATAGMALKWGADITATPYYGWTPLFAASHYGRVEVVKLLVAAEADITVADHRGRTPLYVASLNGRSEMVKLLVDEGADITVADKHGQSPLQIASFYGHVEVVKLLVDKGADIKAVPLDRRCNVW